jgi:flagellin-like protein
MKAISPMVAVILLIAFTIAIGGILSTWLPGLIRTMGGPVETRGEKVAKCSGVYIDVSTTTNNVYLYNPSGYDITGIRVMADGTVIGSGLTLAANGAYTISWARVNNASVRATGFCLNEIPVEGSCSSELPCWR